MINHKSNSNFKSHIIQYKNDKKKIYSIIQPIGFLWEDMKPNNFLGEHV